MGDPEASMVTDDLEEELELELGEEIGLELEEDCELDEELEEDTEADEELEEDIPEYTARLADQKKCEVIVKIVTCLYTQDRPTKLYKDQG